MRLLFFCAIFFIASSTYTQAQTSADVVKTLEQNHSWARAKIIEKSVTLNGPAEMFARILSDKRSFDISTFSYLSSYLGKYYDKVYGTEILNSAEKTAVNTTAEQKAACAKEIAEVAGKLHITLNARNTKLTDNSYELSMTTLTTIGEFLNPERGVGVALGWRPKASKLSIIVNTLNKSGQPVVKWSADLSNCTIDLPIVGDTNYSSVILDGLKKGGRTK
ncbi:hypothetical protein [Mucilaginibacter aquatilis]|uniref:GLPGLI family protein n=1 Tax=Mucilaginibacter aquatilis TaxID=1517760 RepID=A0A6I4IQW9_9SPHI|nr:hypothetical protein [Mucilaginibacter aquatilis]MVN91824.1 hypothetical protein [Mucilaginibacter aquatilis]